MSRYKAIWFTIPTAKVTDEMMVQVSHLAGGTTRWDAQGWWLNPVTGQVEVEGVTIVDVLCLPQRLAALAKWYHDTLATLGEQAGCWVVAGDGDIFNVVSGSSVSG